MANNTKTTVEKDPEAVIGSAIGKTEAWIMMNGRKLLIALGVVIVIVGGFFGYRYLVAGPKAEKASAMMFMAQQQFAIDSFALALHGDGNFAGFLDVIARHGSTPEGNLAKHYAGVCFLRLGQYEQALEYLKKFNPVSGAPASLLNAQNFGLQGDAYSQLQNFKEAAPMYDKAVQASDNTLTAPYYLKKAGAVYEALGEYAKALEAYKKISIEYASSMEARDIQKYIGRVEQL